MDVPGDAADERRVLADQRLDVARAARGRRSAAGRRRTPIVIGSALMPASAWGAPITATTSTAFSSGTSKKLITGVSGRQVLTSLRIARRIAGWTTSANGLASATSGPAALLQRLDDAAAEIGLDRVAARRVGADGLAEQPFELPLQRHHAQRLVHAAQFAG